MENPMLAQIKRLYEYEMYGDVVSVASMLQTIAENDRTTLTIDQEYQLDLFQANAYYHERRFRNAELHFRLALQCKQHLIKHKNALNASCIEAINEYFPEAETKFRMAVSLQEMAQSTDAIKLLQSIPFKHRSPKINFLLAKLQHNNSNGIAATSSYKDVLRECPLSLESIRCLLELGTNGIEVNSLVVNVSSSPPYSDWLNNWIKAHDLLYSQKFLQAADTFKTIHHASKIRNNELLLVMIGESYYYNGNYDAAMRYLSQAHMRKPLMAEGLQSLADIYRQRNKLTELEKLTPTSLNASEYTAENWFVLGQTLYAGGKCEKAAYFAQKAIHMNPRNVEAYLLTMKIFFQLKRYRDAVSILRTVQSIAPYRFEAYRGIVDCYLALNRMDEAQKIAALAVRTIGQTPRTLLLLARTFPKDAVHRKKVKTYLTKALELDEYYLPAVYLLAEVKQEEGDIPGAIKMLKKQVGAHPSARLHAMLGDIMSSEKDMDAALEHYTSALNLDPTNIHALSGLSAMGCSRNASSKPDEYSYTGSSVNEEPTMDFQEHAFEMVEISPALANTEPDNEALWSETYDSEEEVNHN